MKIHVYLRYTTKHGEMLYISGNTPALGSDHIDQALPLQYLDETYWHAEFEVDPKTQPSLQYRYFWTGVGPEGEPRIQEELETDRVLDLAGLNVDTLQVIDAWNPAGAAENAFFSQPFRQIFFKHPDTAPKLPKSYTHLLRVKAPALGPDETLCLLGHGVALRDWDTAAPLLLQRAGNWWTIALNLATADFPLAYKYGVWNTRTNRFVRFEDGPNRPLYAPAHPAGERACLLLHDGFARLPLTTWRGAGVAIPVFSLRSEKSFGVGEFTDLVGLVDWARSVGLRLIQLLPINDTTATHSWRDSYPYAAISAFALHPLFLNLETTAGKKHAALLKPYEKQRKALNQLDAVDYDTVMQVKWDVIRQLYDAQKADWLKDPEYQAYYAANKHWLAPYAAFCLLRDQNETADFNRWKEHSTYSAAAIEKLVSPDAATFDAVGIHLYVQYHLHRQLKAAVDYAHQHGIAFKGDIPIGIYRYSCDAWMAPHLYNMDMQAGAPPDDFAENGQNWGFPTYNWARMEEDGFLWWRQRFEQMSLYFDAFRIDHILGFFRIWSIPIHATDGLMGRFVPALPVEEREFHEAGIGFSFDRFCRPYITDDELYDLFGNAAAAVREQFLNERSDGRYDFKPEFDQQRKIDAWFDTRELNEQNQLLRRGLKTLIGNVILFDAAPAPAPEKSRKKSVPPVLDNGSGQYHFRFGMEKTASFRALDPYVQPKLQALYINYFFRRQEEFWRAQGLRKLPALKRATNMLICGEDLGMVPECVPEVMRDLGLLSLEVQRMPKKLGARYARPEEAPYLSVVTPSTHDMSTVRGWWEEDPAASQKFFNEVLGYHGRAPIFCEPWINRAIIEQHLLSPAMWSIFQLQDLLGIDGQLRRENPHDERINVPANPEHYWRYRMHLTLENLQKAENLNNALREMVERSGRVR